MFLRKRQNNGNTETVQNYIQASRDSSLGKRNLAPCRTSSTKIKYFGRRRAQTKFKAGALKKQYEYSSFSPELVNHEWLITDAKNPY